MRARSSSNRVYGTLRVSVSVEMLSKKQSNLKRRYTSHVSSLSVQKRVVSYRRETLIENLKADA